MQLMYNITFFEKKICLYYKAVSFFKAKLVFLVPSSESGISVCVCLVALSRCLIVACGMNEFARAQRRLPSQ